MPKRFNVTGTCFADEHYMADISGKLAEVLAMIADGAYFTINRPRQYGKTTMLAGIADVLRSADDYVVFEISFEGLGAAEFASTADFCEAFLGLLLLQAEFDHALTEAGQVIRDGMERADKMSSLSMLITRLAHKVDKKMVLLIDEVDKSSNNQLLLDFLGMLRKKFLNRKKPGERTFHAVVLSGVHDVRTLKLKLRPDEEANYNSPWNIATDYEVSMSLQPHEIAPMLEDYAQEHGTALDAPALAERLFYYTSGYPFLVSALCKIVDEQLLAKRDDNNWRMTDVDEAARRLIYSTRSNTNFDSLIKNLENHPELYNLVYRLIIDNETLQFNTQDPLINLGVLHGILRNGEGLRIHNRIYAEVIFNYMISKLATSSSLVRTQTAGPYLLPGNALDVELLLSNFQAYMKEEHSSKDWAFLERNGRLVFLAFVKPILNGKGHTFKEPQISQEQRLDVAITFLERKYIVELKIWRGPKQHEEGLAQLANYLDAQGLAEGYLVIFDPHRVKTIHESSQTEQEWIEIEDKRIFAIWV